MMSFSTDMANLVTAQINRFITLNSYQLAGQVANLDFWLEQVRNALAVIDGYGPRFIRLDAAQEQYVAQHDTRTFQLVDPYHLDSNQRPASAQRIPDRELQKARRGLIEATTRFLDRCHREGFLSESEWATACHSVGIA